MGQRLCSRQDDALEVPHSILLIFLASLHPCEDSDRLEPLVEKILNEAILQGSDRLQQALIAK